MSSHCLLRSVAVVVLVVLFAPLANAQLVNSEWNIGNGDWNVPANWFPNDAPDNGGGFTYNVQIGNRPVAAGAQVTFIPEDGSGDTIETLTISSGADFLTSGNQLNVNGLTIVTGANSTIRLDPHTVAEQASLQSSDLDLTAGGALQMNGGIASVFVDMDVTGTGVLAGFGTLNVGDFDLVIEQAFQNSGLIQVTGTSTVPGLLTIHANGADTIDLDGDSDVGDVDVSNAVADLELDTLTLVIDGPLTDGLGALVGGTLEIGQRDTVTFNDNFEIDAGYSIVMNGGNNVATLNGPGDIVDVADADFAITGAALIANDMTFTGTASTITVNANSSLQLNGTVTIPDASALVLAASSAELIVGGAVTINEAAGNFNWDGPGTATTTIQGTGSLSLTVNQVDSADNIYGGTLNLNDGGDLTVNNAVNSWQAGGVINKNGSGTSSINGDEIAIAGDLIVHAGTLDVNADAIFGSTSDVIIANGATADMATTQIFNGADVTVNGTLSLGVSSVLEAPANLSGNGLFRFASSSTVTANAVVNTASFDWDGVGSGTTHTINDGVVFTINSTTWDADDAGDVDDNINLSGNGAQIVVNNVAGWTMARTLNANNAAAGTATLGGTSTLTFAGAFSVLNVNGNTNITAPVVFGASSTVSIDAAMTLDVVGTASYSGGTIGGAGTFVPAGANSVTADSTINATNFDFDGGNWNISNNAVLTVNVTDYDPAIASNAFNGATITINGGEVDVTTGDAFFVMDGTLNMQTSPGNTATWDGEAIHIGNDAGSLNADINVTGTGSAEFGTNAGLTFNSDADVNVAAGTRLAFLSGMPVTFNTVNGANNAEFTGGGEIEFTGNVNVNEAVTFNMAGGTIDFDSADTNGATVNVDAPFVINAATVQSYGNSNTIGGPDTIDVNNSAGAGVLTVNLDNANAEWTLNGPGVMNLVNDNTDATLLAGSDVNVNGTLNVTGDVRTSARLDIAGVVNINTAAQPLRLAGGNDTNDMNTIAGGNISGVGILAADTGKGLSGHGTINTAIDFDGTADLVASGGTLSFSNFITDVNTIRTSGAAAVFNFLQPVTTNVTDDGILMEGGTIQGAELTVAALNKPLRGTGTVTNRVVNNGLIEATIADLTLQTAGNDNDWDGVFNAGVLSAINGSTLELRDVGAAFGFGGAVTAGGFGRVYANGFALDFNPGSTITLTQGTYESTNSTDIGGTVTVNAGVGSTIKVENNSFLTFETGSATTLNADLELQNNNIIVEAGASFSGGGALVIPDGSHVVGENLANIGVLFDMQGAFRPGNSQGIGRIDLFDYQSGDTSELYIELIGTSLNAFDRLVASGDVIVDGFLSLDIDDISPGVPFVPVLGNTFNIITGNSVTGAFDTVDVSGMPAGLAFHVEYLANAVQLQVVNKPIFSADFDDDGDVDSTDLSIWKNAFNLNQLGDADGDNDSDGADFMLWQRQFGSAPAVAVAQPAAAAVPEPSMTALLLGAIAGVGWRRSRDRL